MTGVPIEELEKLAAEWDQTYADYDDEQSIGRERGMKQAADCLRALIARHKTETWDGRNRGRSGTLLDEPPALQSATKLTEGN